MRKTLTSNKAVAKQLTAEMAQITKATNVVKSIAREADLDPEILDRRIAAANKHEYGTTAGLLNLITAITLWPVDKDGDKNGISEVQDNILSVLNKINKKTELTLVFFERLKECRGSHTFLSDDHTVIAGKEPEYARYAEMLVYLATALDITIMDFKLDDTSWKQAEERAEAKAANEFVVREDELKKHESEMAALEAKVAKTA